MDTHRDDDTKPSAFLDQLQAKAEEMRANRESEITSGKPNEPFLERWQYGEMNVTQRPDDEHSILRISIGGSERLGGSYCVFRGDQKKCANLLRKALRALEAGPGPGVSDGIRRD